MTPSAPDDTNLDEPTPEVADATDSPDAEASGDDWDSDPLNDGAGPNQQAVRAAQIGLVVVALLIGGFVALTRSDDEPARGFSPSSADPGTSAAGSGGQRPNWPADVRGRPKALGKRGQTAGQVDVASGTPAGIYIWNDFDGWHLWVVGGAAVPEISGTMESDDDIAKSELAVAGTGTVTTKGPVTTFTLPAGAALSGLDLNPGFFVKKVIFTLKGPDGPIDPGLIHVGSAAAEAPVPLVFSYDSQP